MYDGQKNITMQQLETLFCLMEERSFSRAARRMYLSQPALTRQVKNLEEILGVLVLNRDSRGLSLTEEGKILYEYARRILKLREEVRDKIARVQKHEAGDIYVSASTIPATYILPYALSGFRMSHPEIRAHIQTAASGEALEAILSGQGELGFIGRNPLNTKLHAEPIWRDRLILAIGKDHPWRGQDSVAISALMKEPLVLRERGSATREIMERALKEKDVPPLNSFRIICEVGSSEAAKEAVIAGLGVSIISFYAVARELKMGLICEAPLRDFNIERSFYLIWRRQYALTHYHQLFVDFIRKYQPAGWYHG